MSLEERLEKAEKLVAEVKAELAAMRVTKRNWPERIEAGDCFEQANGSRYLVCGSKFVNLDTGALWLLGGGPSGNDKTDLSYLGKIDLTIRTDAHEPTGAELVGRRVNCFDVLDQLQFEGVCDKYNPDATCPYRIGRAWYFKARLAK